MIIKIVVLQTLIKNTPKISRKLANFKLTIGDSEGKSTVHELKESQAQPLVGMKIGDELDASMLGAKGKIKITGGSDKSGVPMRPDVHGGVKKYVLLPKGIGLQNIERGHRRRKLVRGNVITEEIYQVNAVQVS